jgi:NTE family protein
MSPDQSAKSSVLKCAAPRKSGFERKSLLPAVSSPAAGTTVGRQAAAFLSVCLFLAALPGCAARQRPPENPPPGRVAVRPRIGLALGGGGARGFAHLGALRVLEQEKIPIDLVVGTSVGSLIGALYADQGRVIDAEITGLEVEESDLFDYQALAVLTGGLVKGERLERFLHANLKHQAIEEMAIPFAAVAVDIESGRTVIFRRGSAASAVHASCAIPGVFVPVSFEGHTYIDGGVTNPVPASIARDLGADLVIAMAIPPPVPGKPAKNPLSVAYRAVAIMSAEIGRLRAGEADVVIETRADRQIDPDDFSQKRLLIEAGDAAARAALPAIRAAIEAKTRWVAADSIPVR